ncbi:MAG: T9SS type A sorting domain-containing protein [Saprospiraceae bacterium]|nr:T9SS type A sorting domain-containing protein [Saprospiraceae bacterium]
MKKQLTLALGLAFASLFQFAVPNQIVAQGTDGLNLVLRVTINGQDYEYFQGTCGYETANWGGTVTAEFCGNPAWGYDITPDSLGCDSIPAGQLTGKIAMIRRGACEFGLKALNAEKAGAIAVMIVNSDAATAGDDCNAIPMGAGAVGAQVTIPAIFLSRVVGNQIDAAISAGQNVEVCFLLPNVGTPYVARAYATPVTQVIENDVMSMVFYNRGTTVIDDLVVKADITGPNGYTNTIETAAPPLDPGFSGLVFFDTWLPPSVPGKYDVVMSNNKFTESRDTLRRSFEITDYTFAVDNLNLIDARLWNNGSFVAGNFLYQTGALYFTGSNGGVATYSTFGISNIDSIYTGDPEADLIQVLVYDADSDENGVINFQSGGFNDLAADLVGTGSYILQGNESFDKVVHVQLEDFFDPGQPVTLKPDHAYYISLLYDGINNGSGRCPGFNASASEDYLVYDGGGLTTPLQMDALYSGWGGGTLVNRMELEGFDPTISVKEAKPQSLDASKFSITPNPGNEYVYLNLDLENVNKKVNITILSASGQVFRTKLLNDFQSGQIRFDVSDVPSGYYLMWIRTNEGNTIQKVAICH